MKNIGIYLHIPFCKKKCFYCDFISYCNEENNIYTYIECMKKEIKFKASELNKFSIKNQENYEIDTIYIGGGTPSYIDSKFISDLIDSVKKSFNVKNNCEITIELNPDSTLFEKLFEYKKTGINRISIGLQSSKDKLLKEIGRVHNFEQFKRAYYNIKKAGFTNINVDLMIALPNQSLEDINDSVEEIMNLEPSHISVYSLILEENTILFEKVKNGELILPNEELEREMYWYVKDKLEKRGYMQYEISNFAKNEKESKHNLNCWKQNEYLGIGLNAHSFFNSIRFSNTDNIANYIKNIRNQNYKDNQIIQEILSLEDKQREFMILGLRIIKGVEIKHFKEKFGQNPIYVFRKEINKLEKEDLIEIDGDCIKLTKKGLDFANVVWEEFV